MIFDDVSAAELSEPAAAAKTHRRLVVTLGAVIVLGLTGVIWWTTAILAGLQSDRPKIDLSLQFPAVPPPPSADDYRVMALRSQKMDLQNAGWQMDLDWLTKGLPSTPFDDPKLPARQDDHPDQLAAVAPSAPPEVVERDAGIGESDIGAPVRQRHFKREHKPEPSQATAPKPRRLAARHYYLEKSVEQGDSGDVSFHYRRRDCTPGHMVDVCFMPAENRRNIVVEHF